MFDLFVILIDGQVFSLISLILIGSINLFGLSLLGLLLIPPTDVLSLRGEL